MTAVALRNPVVEDDQCLEYLVSAGPDDRVASILSLGFFTATWWTMQDGHGQGSDTRVQGLDKEFTALAEACDEADAE